MRPGWHVFSPSDSRQARRRRVPNLSECDANNLTDVASFPTICPGRQRGRERAETDPHDHSRTQANMLAFEPPGDDRFEQACKDSITDSPAGRSSSASRTDDP